jgi:hypothetical protein
MWHPWRRLRELAHITLHSADLPDGALGYTDCTTTIVLTTGLTQAERRCTLDHELVHIERGPAPHWLEAREERTVNEITARRMIPFDALADAMVWSFDDHELAEELWVDVDTVRNRLAALTDEESAELNRRLDAAEARIP